MLLSFFFLLFIYSDDAASLESTHTLTNETFNESNDACETSDVITAPKRKKNNKQDTEMNGECSNEALSPQLSTSPSSFGCSSPGSGDIDAKDDDNDNDGHQNAGKNSARYKRRNSNNGNSISLPRTPLATPMPRRREFGKKRNTTTIKTTTLTTAPVTFTLRTHDAITLQQIKTVDVKRTMQILPPTQIVMAIIRTVAAMI